MGAHGQLKKTKYFSIDEIPDSLIPTESKRDPGNPVYQTRRWVNFKKKQILFQQQDGVPRHLRTPFNRYLYYGIWTATIGLAVTNMYLLIKYTSKKTK